MSSSQKLNRIQLTDVCGKCCTVRKNPGLEKLSHQMMDSIRKSEKTIIVRKNVKLMSVSFVDELIARLANQAVSPKSITDLVEFDHPLEEIYLDQWNRSLKSRF